MMKCPCYRCTKERVEASPLVDSEKMFGLLDPRLMIMFLCEKCGNKRCPHAADHRNACTWSNDPGQPGSLYENIPGAPLSALPARGEVDDK